MPQVIRLVQGDTRPTLIVNIKDSQTDQPVDLSGCDVRLLLREVDSSAPADVIQGFVTNGINGDCVFQWSPQDLALAGDFEGEVEITFADARIQTVFDLLYFVIREQFSE